MDQILIGIKWVMIISAIGGWLYAMTVLLGKLIVACVKSKGEARKLVIKAVQDAVNFIIQKNISFLIGENKK